MDVYPFSPAFNYYSWTNIIHERYQFDYNTKYRLHILTQGTDVIAIICIRCLKRSDVTCVTRLICIPSLRECTWQMYVSLMVITLVHLAILHIKTFLIL